MNNLKRMLSLALAVISALSLFSGCDSFDSLLSKINGKEETYTLTKGFTYTESEESTSVYYIRTSRTEDGFKYKLYSSYCEIVGYSGNNTDITVPAEIENTPVTVIGENAFADSYVTSVSLPDSVTRIEKSAFFDCKSLLQIDFGKNVESVGRYAFFGCNNLISISFGESLKEIEEYAFNSCSAIESIVFPDSLEYLGNHSFYLCSSLFKVFIPDSVSKLGIEVFKSCDNNFKIYAPAESSASKYANDNSILYVECYSYLEESYKSDLNEAYVEFDDEEHTEENDDSEEEQEQNAE